MAAKRLRGAAQGMPSPTRDGAILGGNLKSKPSKATSTAKYSLLVS